MSKWLNVVSYVLFSLTALIIGFGVARGERPWEPLIAARDPLVLDAPSKSFGREASHQTIPITFTLTNHSGRPVRVVGASNYCSRWGCVVAQGLPFEIAAEGAHDVTIELETREPGPFDQSINVFTDCPGRGELTLRITGEITALPAEGEARR